MDKLLFLEKMVIMMKMVQYIYLMVKQDIIMNQVILQNRDKNLVKKVSLMFLVIGMISKKFMLMKMELHNLLLILKLLFLQMVQTLQQVVVILHIHLLVQLLMVLKKVILILKENLLRVINLRSKVDFMIVQVDGLMIVYIKLMIKVLFSFHMLIMTVMVYLLLQIKIKVILILKEFL